MEKMDISNITSSELAKMFIDYINITPKEDLLKTFKNDVVDEYEEKVLGKFRLIYALHNNDEYITFTGSFFGGMGQDKLKKLIVFCIEKNETVIACEFNDDMKSWISNIHYEDISVSCITNMASKLKSVLV